MDLPKGFVLPCLCCGKELEAAVPKDVCDNQPCDANVFTSHGAYGSTMFDPMNDSFLEINVCSDCLRAAVKNNRIVKVDVGYRAPATLHYGTWYPEGEY